MTVRFTRCLSPFLLLTLALICSSQLSIGQQSLAGARVTWGLQTPQLAPMPASKSGQSSPPNQSGTSVPRETGIKLSDILAFAAALVSALLGALVGGMIGRRAGIETAETADRLSQRREQEARSALREAVRVMLRVEIDQNLKMLRDLTEILSHQPADQSGIEWMIANPTPDWSTTVWQACILHAASSLTEVELQEIQSHYLQLKSLSAAASELKLTSTLKAANYHAQLQPLHSAEALAESVLRLGNPLASKGNEK